MIVLEDEVERWAWTVGEVARRVRPGGVVARSDGPVGEVARWARPWVRMGKAWVLLRRENNVNGNKETDANEDAQDLMYAAGVFERAQRP